MNMKVTTAQEDIAELALETETVFDSVQDAKAFLNDNYTTGDWVIYDDQDNGGAQIYRA